MLSLFKDKKRREVLFLSLSAAALAADFFDIAGLPIEAAWLAIILCGMPIIKEAAEGLLDGFSVKADLLVSIALIASVAIGEVFAAGEVAFIMALGEFLEERTAARARSGIERLAALSPVAARVVRGGAEEMTSAENVRAGDVLRVLAGETIAADGVIIRGRTTVDQSALTGEAMPADKEEGDPVFGGTVNRFGAFDMEASKDGKDSSIQRMIRLVEAADAGKAKIVGLADRWAAWIVGAALLAAVIAWLVSGQALRAVAILVVFCPCALVLATPAAIMAGIGNASKKGMLVREGDALERLSQVSIIAFDKTGTLTFGRPEVTRIFAAEPALGEKGLLELAASAELRSEHPLGKAVAEAYRKKFGAEPGQPDEFEALPGRGVRARLGKLTVLAGKKELMEEGGVELSDEARAFADSVGREGGTAVYIACLGRLAGALALEDRLRPTAASVVEAASKASIASALLTGDSEAAARRAAKEAGIGLVAADCLPEEKHEAVRAWQAKGERVCMVGDGINDAAALKAAHVGIAIGGIGSDIAIEAADIVLVGEDIGGLPHLIGLAGKTMKTIRFNIAASMLLNFIAIALAAAGLLSPALGALVHNAGSVAVILNSAALYTWGRAAKREPRRNAAEGPRFEREGLPE